MPGWHELTLDLQRAAKIRMLGIIEEQHPERCQLFMQWKRMEWPIMVDSLNLLEVTAVPITVLVDESGQIYSVQPQAGDVKSFLNSPPADEGSAPPVKPVRPDLDELRKRAHQGAAADWMELANALVNWAEASQLDEAIAAFRRALEMQPEEGRIHFRLGVAFRKRHDSASRQPGDFGAAIEHWTQALAFDPNQYIWRRRIQQYGPRLDKPYPFYDWIHMAAEEIRARGERPLSLLVEPGGTEMAAPVRDLVSSGGTPPEPDPEGRIHRDEAPLIEIEPVVVSSTDPGVAAARVHLIFRPNQSIQAHWNNETGPLAVWMNPPEGWTLSSRYHAFPTVREAVSDEIREIEFEAKAERGRMPPAATLHGYALYYVCEGAKGACLYRRQDLSIALPP